MNEYEVIYHGFDLLRKKKYIYQPELECIKVLLG